MKVVLDPIILKINPYGGIARYWHSLEEGLAEGGYDIYNVGRLLNERKAYIERFLKFYPNIENPDIIHSSYYRIPKNNSFSSQVIITAYDCIHERFRSGLTRMSHIFAKKRALTRADKIIAISESTKLDLLKFYNLDPDKIFVCHLNVDNIFKTDEVINDIPEKMLFVKKQPVFLFVGNRNGYKCFQTALNAVSKLKDASMIIVGGGKLNQREVQILNSKLPGRFSFFNYLTDEKLKWLYRNCVALLYPSNYEGFGLPPLECIMSGGHVIAKNTSSIKEIMPHNYAGLVKSMNTFEYESVVSLFYKSKKIKSPFETDNTFRKKWKKYSWIEKTKTIYNL